MTVKRMREMIWNTAYAGVIAEKWTLHKPVKAKFKGLVDIEIYNLALKGKKVIQEGTNGLEILLNQKPKARMSHNPLYPFKSLKCHVCGNSLLGSAPKSKSGKHIPRYHCSRNHKYWSENKKNFEKTIYKFISEVNFSKKYFLLFKEIVRDVWLKKQQDAVQESLTYGQKVIQLRAEKQSLLDKIKSTSNNYLINELALEMEKIDNEIIQAELHRDDKEEKEHDIESLLNYTEYFMEHLEELLIDRDNPIKQIALFDLLFEEMPTYRNIYNGTPK